MNTDHYAVLNVLHGPVDSIGSLKGRYLIKIEGGVGDNELRMYLSPTQYVRFYHEQDCCESVSIADITGDLNDLIGEMIMEAEESTKVATGDECCESGTWTFYRFGTRKGSVVIRWLGESNGYYSESVDYEFVGMQ